MIIMAWQFNYKWTDSAKKTELWRTPPNKKNEDLAGRFVMLIPSNSEFFGLEGFCMRWSLSCLSLPVNSSDYMR